MSLTKPLTALLCVVPGPACALDLEDIMGEWSMDADSCIESRVTFTIDQMHEALIAENGRWVSLAAAPFTIDGDTILIEDSPAGAEHRLEVVSVERDRLLLRTDDEERAAAIGTDSLALVRCPSY